MEKIESNLTKPTRSLKSILIICISILAAAFAGIALYAFNNFTFIAEKAAVYSLKPIKHNIAKELIEENICYDRSDCGTYFITMFKQKKQIDRPKPLMIILASNFWHNSSINHYFHLAGLAHRAGFIVAMVNLPQGYGPIRRFLAPESNFTKNRIPAQIQKVEQALQYLRENIHKYNGNPADIHITAVEAAAQLLLSSLYLPSSSIEKSQALAIAIKKITLINPILHLHDKDTVIYDRYLKPLIGESQQDLAKYSPLQFIDLIESQILILEPHKNFEFMAYGLNLLRKKIEQDPKLQKKIELFTAKEKSPKTMVYKLGRKDDAASAVMNRFWLQ